MNLLNQSKHSMITESKGERELEAAVKKMVFLRYSTALLKELCLCAPVFLGRPW